MYKRFELAHKTNQKKKNKITGNNNELVTTTACSVPRISKSCTDTTLPYINKISKSEYGQFYAVEHCFSNIRQSPITSLAGGVQADLLRKISQTQKNVQVNMTNVMHMVTVTINNIFPLNSFKACSRIMIIG
jgi:hypothetical protein